MDKPNILTEDQIKQELSNLPGWTFANDKISKKFEFKDFLDSLGFVSSLADFFEANDHHPDIHIYYSKIQFDLQRFDIGGKVTDRDILVAHKIEEAYQAR